MYTHSIQGIQQNTALMQKYASNLKDIEKADLPRDMVGIMVAEHGVSANIAALRAAMRMDDSLIDIVI